jgi:sterol desaturase/sphingolipid hydroxylase (fatty acid hydroxylase superfamily)
VGRDFQSEIASKEKLRSAALTVAVLVIFFSVVLTLTALFWLLLTGLTTLLALSGLAWLVVLSGLSTLALSGLTALLALFLHIVCHEYPS